MSISSEKEKSQISQEGPGYFLEFFKLQILGSVDCCEDCGWLSWVVGDMLIFGEVGRLKFVGCQSHIRFWRQNNADAFRWSRQSTLSPLSYTPIPSYFSPFHSLQSNSTMTEQDTITVSEYIAEQERLEQVHPPTRSLDFLCCIPFLATDIHSHALCFG